MKNKKCFIRFFWVPNLLFEKIKYFFKYLLEINVKYINNLMWKMNYLIEWSVKSDWIVYRFLKIDIKLFLCI